MMKWSREAGFTQTNSDPKAKSWFEILVPERLKLSDHVGSDVIIRCQTAARWLWDQGLACRRRPPTSKKTQAARHTSTPAATSRHRGWRVPPPYRLILITLRPRRIDGGLSGRQGDFYLSGRFDHDWHRLKEQIFKETDAFFRDNVRLNSCEVQLCFLRHKHF